MILGGFCTLGGAYNVSVTIRTADKYDIWSRLEAALPKHPFWLWWKKQVVQAQRYILMHKWRVMLLDNPPYIL